MLIPTYLTIRRVESIPEPRTVHVLQVEIITLAVLCQSITWCVHIANIVDP